MKTLGSTILFFILLTTSALSSDGHGPSNILEMACSSSAQDFFSSAIKAENSSNRQEVINATAKGLRARKACPHDSLIEEKLEDLEEVFLELSRSVMEQQTQENRRAQVKKCRKATNTFLRKLKRADKARTKKSYGIAYASGLQVRKDCGPNTSIEDDIELQKTMYLRS